MNPAPLSNRHRYTAWGITWLAYATYYTGRKGFSVAKKTLETEVGITRDALGAIDTAYLAAYALGQFANGLLGDRIGSRRLLGLGLLLSAAACAFFGTVSGTLLFGVAFCVNGYAQSSGWPGTTRAMAEWTTPRTRGRVMALWATCYQVGGIVATAGAAWLLGRYGWRAAFYAPAAWMALVAGLIFVLLRANPEHEPREGDVHRHRQLAGEARRRVLRSRVLWSYGASYFSIKLIRYSLLFWLPYYLSDRLGYAADEAGYVSTAFEVGGIAGVVALGIASDRLRRYSRSLLAACSLVGLALALLLYTQIAELGTAANVFGLALIGATLFGPDSLVSGAAAQDVGGPHAAATATGFVNGMGSVGAILQGAVTVGVSRAFGWESLFWVFIGLAVVGALALVPSLKAGRVSEVQA